MQNNFYPTFKAEILHLITIRDSKKEVLPSYYLKNLIGFGVRIKIIQKYSLWRFSMRFIQPNAVIEIQLLGKSNFIEKLYTFFIIQSLRIYLSFGLRRRENAPTRTLNRAML